MDSTSAPVRGLTADVLAPSGRTHPLGRVTVVGELVDKVRGTVFTPSPAAPAVHVRHLGGKANLVLVDPAESGVGPMFGGCFVWSSDARFRELSELVGFGGGPIPLHDRFESAADYNAELRAIRGAVEEREGALSE